MYDFSAELYSQINLRDDEIVKDRAKTIQKMWGNRTQVEEVTCFPFEMVLEVSMELWIELFIPF